MHNLNKLTDSFSSLLEKIQMKILLEKVSFTKQYLIGIVLDGKCTPKVIIKS